MLYHFGHIPRRPENDYIFFFRDIIHTGWMGVDLFFVLSGFLITRILLATRDDENRWKNFIFRRVLRIFPVYFTYLIALFLLVHWQYDLMVASRSNISYSEDWWMAFLFIPNVSVLLTGHNIGPGTGHLWSLGIEEQFYLLWPLIVFHTSVATLRRICLLIIPLAFATRIFLVLQGFDSWQIYTFTLSRFDALATGALLATFSASWIREHARPFAILCFLLCLISVVLIAVAGPRVDSSPIMYTIGLTIVTACFGTFVALTAHELFGVSRRLSHPVLIFFGSYSYTLYVVHPLLRAFFVQFLNRYFPSLGYLESFLVTTVVVGGSSVVFAMLSWRLLEQPILALKAHFGYSRTAYRRLDNAAAMHAPAASPRA